MITPVTIVDARMGRGKSSAAIRYMKEHPERKFLYITPYLKEVDRICKSCDFEQPDDTYSSKSMMLKGYLKTGQNVAATHSLFYLLDSEALEYIVREKYTLIVDESIETVAKVQVSGKDLNLLLDRLVVEDERGKLTWTDPEYEGKFTGYKQIADVGCLFRQDQSLLSILDPELLRAFEHVYMLTYLFDGQFLKAYLEYFSIPYVIVGVVQDEGGFSFSDAPDNPPPVDFRDLIRIVDVDGMNEVGVGRTALSKSWYSRRGFEHPDIRALRKNLRSFFGYPTPTPSSKQLWTTFADDRTKIAGKQNRYASSWLQVGARATNEYRGRNRVAYLVNRFSDPSLNMFFRKKGCDIDEDVFALSEMLQWIWRSSIRDGKPIDLYIPSLRMRSLLKDWIDRMWSENDNGGERSA